MKRNPYIKKQLHELLYQALETERGGIKIYETALLCAQNKDLQEEWEEYLEQTRTHEQVLLEVFDELGLNPETVAPRAGSAGAHRGFTGLRDRNGQGARQCRGCAAGRL